MGLELGEASLDIVGRPIAGMKDVVNCASFFTLPDHAVRGKSLKFNSIPRWNSTCPDFTHQLSDSTREAPATLP